MGDSVLLQAFEGKNKRVPVWLMRQAGRYLPEYQALRKGHSLDEMFRDPEIAAEVTCLPVSKLGVDGAILYADILTLPRHLGFDVKFDPERGPVIDPPLRGAGDLARLHDMDDVPYVRETIARTLSMLPHDIPLIGFAGAPFTVLCYLMEGGSSQSFRTTLSFAYRCPGEYRRVMDFLTRNTVSYLRMQAECGAAVFQLFDTWAGILPPRDYEMMVLPYVREIFAGVDLPGIYYVKNCLPLLSLMERSGAAMLSLCSQVDLAAEPFVRTTELGIQGNLFNGALFAEDAVLREEVLRILSAARGLPKYIFNLSHGIHPNTDPDKVKMVVEMAQGWRKDA